METAFALIASAFLAYVMSFLLMWFANTFFGPKFLDFFFGGPLTHRQTAGLLAFTTLLVITIVGLILAVLSISNG